MRSETTTTSFSVQGPAGTQCGDCRGLCPTWSASLECVRTSGNERGRTWTGTFFFLSTFKIVFTEPPRCLECTETAKPPSSWFRGNLQSRRRSFVMLKFRRMSERLECRRNNIKTQIHQTSIFWFFSIKLSTQNKEELKPDVRLSAALKALHNTWFCKRDWSRTELNPVKRSKKLIETFPQENTNKPKPVHHLFVFWVLKTRNLRRADLFASRRPFLVSAVVDHKLINKTVQRGNATDETSLHRDSQIQQNTTDTKGSRPREEPPKTKQIKVQEWLKYCYNIWFE